MPFLTRRNLCSDASCAPYEVSKVMNLRYIESKSNSRRNLKKIGGRVADAYGMGVTRDSCNLCNAKIFFWWLLNTLVLTL
ncbi:protein of unknown function [Pararobbsia alpina]